MLTRFLRIATKSGLNSSPVVFLSSVVVGLTMLILASLSIGLPDNEIRAASFEPTGRTDLKTNITVKFTKAMVSKDSLDQPVLEPPLSFTPPIRGLARWVETDVLRFFPDAALLPATEYRARVQSDKTWAGGFKIVTGSMTRTAQRQVRHA